MTISATFLKINLPLMRDIECSVCNETVIEKAAKSALSIATPTKHEFCFYGHMCEGLTTKSIIPHLICEECNPGVTTRSTTEDAFRKCISCNVIPAEDWREKYTWDTHTQEFRRELKPLPPKAYVMSKKQAYIAGIIIALFMATLSGTYEAIVQKNNLSSRITVGVLGLGVGLLISQKAGMTTRELSDIGRGAAFTAKLLSLLTNTDQLYREVPSDILKTSTVGACGFGLALLLVGLAADIREFQELRA